MSTLLPPPHPCAETLRVKAAEVGTDVTVMTKPPLVALYSADPFTCPHGITYWIQPTEQQIAQWERDGTR